jgi:drug/metabolite transporter (DMT)-like permease
MRKVDHRKLGMLFAAGAAICYGLAGIAGKLAYSGGGNTFTILAYRNIISIPILFFILKATGISLKVTKKQLLGLVYLGLQGGFATVFFMYSSFEYISVGLAICLHFCFPVIVAFIYVVIFKEKLSRTKALALLFAFIGVWFFLESNAVVNPKGLLLALASGLSNAFFLTALDKLGLKVLNGMVISLYCCIVGAIAFLTVGTLAGYVFTDGLQLKGWILIFAGAILISVLANAMVPTAVKYVGPTVTGILGIIEPFISVLLSMLILHEPFGIRSVFGAIFVLTAAGLLTLEKETPEDIMIEKAKGI